MSFLQKKDISSSDITGGDNSPLIHGTGNRVTINTLSTHELKNIQNNEKLNDFEKEIFHNLFLHNSKIITLSFKSDSLCLARLVNCLNDDKEINKEDLLISLTGYDNELNSEIHTFGYYVSGLLDGYIRNIKINIKKNSIVDVGGSNATLEKIAASNIDVIVTREIYDNILTPYLPFYRVDGECHFDYNTLIEQFKHEQIESVIAVARHIADETSLKILLNYLDRNFKPKIMEFITEGFRSFEFLCSSNLDLSCKATFSLILYIKKNIKNKELSLSIVYAIESLGYVSNHHSKTKEMVVDFLQTLISKDSNLYIHRDILWSTIVSIERNLIKNTNINKIKSITENTNNNILIIQKIFEAIEKKYFLLR